MSAWSILGIIVGSIVVLFVGMRLLLVYKITKQKGKPSPELPGKMGKVVRKGRPALFYFYSPQCGACRTMTPVVKEMEKAGKDVFAIDISVDMATARKFGVMATPTTVQVNKGIIEDIIIGPRPKAQLESLVA